VFNLIRVHQTTHTIFNAHNIVVHSVHVSIELVAINYETSGIETAEIERTSWLQLRCVKTEWVQEHGFIGTTDFGRSGVVILRHHGVVWVDGLGIRDIGTIDLQTKLVVNETEIAWVIRRDILDWMIVVHFLDSSVRQDGSLRLVDDHVLWSIRQSGAFIGIQVDVLRVNFIISGRWILPCNAQFNIVVLERNQWDRGLPVFTERKAEWVERPRRGNTRGGGLGVILSHGVWRNVLGKVRRLFVDDLATDQPLDLLDSVDPISFIERIWVAIRDVAVSEEIPLAFETNGGDTTGSWNALEHLAFYGLGKICVTSIVRSEKTDFRLADEVGILGADGDELGNTTRHFIYIEVIFLNGYLYMMVLHHVKITRSCFDQLTFGSF